MNIYYYKHPKPRANPKAAHQEKIAHSQNHAASRKEPRDPSKPWTGPQVNEQDTIYSFKEITIKIPVESFDQHILARQSYTRSGDGLYVIVEPGKEIPKGLSKQNHSIYEAKRYEKVTIALHATEPNSEAIADTKPNEASAIAPALAKPKPPKAPPKPKVADPWTPTVPAGPRRPISRGHGWQGR